MTIKGFFIIKLDNLRDKQYIKAGFSLEYWDEKTLFKISRAIGTPIKVDESTLKYESGYSAKVLIDGDLEKAIPNKLWIISKFGGFMQSVLLPQLPKFCGYCKIIGHLQPECRFKQGNNENKSPKSTPKNSVNEKLQDKTTEVTVPFDICNTPASLIQVNKEIVHPNVEDACMNTGRFYPLLEVTEEIIDE
ncbi:uncharacterized protein LOC113324525 [Papaver somniferum]|uniref:uncharacterized protein LOC113324525 n=1 Tax=Papaver somniferum TaxID=3469 RepID=UPI000E704A74|nr:uncharacterized protein LOC113324525 [Papaver somniferum]